MALRALWYDREGERSSVGAGVFIRGGEVNGPVVGTQAAVAAGQGGAVVVGVRHLDPDGSRGCYRWIL